MFVLSARVDTKQNTCQLWHAVGIEAEQLTSPYLLLLFPIHIPICIEF